MVDPSAMVAREPAASGAEEEISHSFAEILESSPPSSSKKQHFAKDANNIGAALPPGIRRESSRAGIFGRLANSSIRNSVLRRDYDHPRGSTRSSVLADTAARQSSVPVGSEPSTPRRPSRNRGFSRGTNERSSSAFSDHVSAMEERVPRMTFDPPSLGAAYSKAVICGPILAPTGSVDAILRTHKSRDNHKKPELEAAAANRRPATPSEHDSYSTKVYVLTTTGHLLQYAGEGNNDRIPERIMQLNSGSAAVASDAIPGKHRVLHVSTTSKDQPSHHRSRFALSKLGLGGSKSSMQNFLLIMDSADELDGWLRALRRAIQSLAEQHHKAETTKEKLPAEKTADSSRQYQTNTDLVREEHASVIAARPGLVRATTAPDVISSHRITRSMAKRGLLLRMDESDSEYEPDASVSISNSRALPHGPFNATSPASTLSITDNASYRSRPSTEAASSPRNASTGRRPSWSTDSGSLFFHLSDLDSVVEDVTNRSSQQLPVNILTTEPTGFRKKTNIPTTQSMSPSCNSDSQHNQPQFVFTHSARAALQPLSAGFKRLSPLADLGPIVLTPPESPEVSILVRPRSLSMLEDVIPTLSPRPDSLKSPISDPGLLSTTRIASDHSENSTAATDSKAAILSKSPPSQAPEAADEGQASMFGGNVITQTASWIPPRHSSLMYQPGIIPTPDGSGKSTPSSSRKRSLTPAKGEKPKVRLAALDTVNLPHANALLLAPSPHPPPTGALPDLPRCRSPSPLRLESHADQVRKTFVVSAASDRSASVSSIRKGSGAERTASPEPTAKHDETLVVQFTPRKARVEKVILPSMADVPAIRPQGKHHLATGSGPSLTVAERRRRRSPSPVQSRGRSSSQAEKVLSAISEITEASEAPRAMDEMITVGFAEPVQDESEPTSETKSSLSKDLLPNGMPNPLAGNPIRTPDMRMIPRPPSRDAPEAPAIPALHREIHKGPETHDTTHKEDRSATKPPMTRRPSILERAIAALEAAKDGKSRSTKDEPQHQSSSEPLAAVAPHFQATLRPFPPRESRSTSIQPVFTPSPHARASPEPGIASEPRGQPTNPNSQPPSTSILPPPPSQSTQSEPPIKHISQLPAIAVLPAEPMTPPIPEMKASITAFHQDEFDMRAWPVNAGKELGERYAPLSLDISGHTGGDGEGETGEEEGPKSKVGAARWSLFNAIEGIE